MAEDSRPLSPHLQVYRWQLQMAMSIAHRATGIALTAGTVLLVVWLAAAASPSAQAFADVQWFIGSFVGRLLLFGWTVSLMYHLCSGIRHLIWDTGRGFEIATAIRGGQIVIAATVVLTLLAWILGYAAMGH